MIVQFSVTNFRSIDEEQTLDLYMTGYQGGLLGNTVPFKGTQYRFLKSIGIYGANASGKSNLLLALSSLRKMILTSWSFREDQTIDYFEPCSFREQGTTTSPTKFEIEFTLPYEKVETRFVYALHFNKSNVVYERLGAYFSNRESLLFLREKIESQYNIEFGASFKGGAKNIPCFPNQSYLSVAGRNAASPEIIRHIVSYLRNKIVHIDSFEKRMFMLDKSHERAWNLVSHIDVGINSARLEENNVSEEDLHFPADLPSKIKESFLNNLRRSIVLNHNDSLGKNVDIDFEEESDGTKKMIRLLPKVTDALVSGGVIIIDELDNSMHPFMAEMIVKLFNDSDLNQGQAQIIFTTHNANLLSQDLMRRDQIWFAEKTNGRSRYYSLDCFDKKEVTPHSPYIRWYLEGRFGAIPSINYEAIVKRLVEWRKEGGTNAQKE